MSRRPLVLVQLLIGIAVLVTPLAPADAWICRRTGNRCVTWGSANAHMKFILGFAPQQLSNGTFNFNDNAIFAAQDWNVLGSRFQFTWETGSVLIDPCGPQGAGHTCTNTGPVGDNPVFMTGSVCGSGFGDIIAQTTSCFDTRNATMVNAPVFVDANRNWDAYDGPLRGRYDIRRVLAHELGHVLGLDHPDDHGQSVLSLMNRRISDVDRPQHDDATGARELYGGNGSNGGGGDSSGGCSLRGSPSGSTPLLASLGLAALLARRRRPWRPRLHL